ncbi:geranyltranstransferase [Luminiphilus syltensis NOR5-1B]|uniref:Geranyltranstransferase n=1 Tax=Luminiphilus syltensis NOR5-1B TaxID=565045 RepID=B8KWB6_9GAMM|nr:farnesyl diphosphate synthase [Luminiphilus syltensis]EED35071.1 geranyltranstransferase [Luminiphilus syltensis NOR5-1B]
MSAGEPHSIPCPDPQLAAAAEYVLANPGKQLRAKLVRETAAMLGSADPNCGVETVATAIELLHSYSLVHDDLPAMDNDDLRRGRPTVHRAFDEATAILVGDGFQARAFEIIARDSSLSAEQRVELFALLSQAVGFEGMVGGQALDMAAEHQQCGIAELTRLHRLKTGALIQAAVVGGAIVAGANRETLDRLATFAMNLGLAFQVIDDVLDVTACSDDLGKTAGKDAISGKSTYVTCLGIDGAKAEAARLLNEAVDALEPFGESALALRDVALSMVERSK